MADLNSLGYRSISQMSQPEAFELIKQIRLSRRTPTKTYKPKPTSKKEVRKSNKKITDNLNPELAKELLKMLEAE